MRFCFVKQGLLFFYLFFIATGSQAQFISATVGIDGLTCSSCSYGVEQSLRKLDFVQAVKTDLNAATATILFTPGAAISFNEISKKVYQAGFSVRFLNAVYNFNEARTISGDTLLMAQRVFYFLEKPSAPLKGNITLQFIGEKMANRKTMKQWEPQMQLARMKYPLLLPDTYFVVL